jgi:crotonobetaine/carnitine-CoA ligase
MQAPCPEQTLTALLRRNHERYGTRPAVGGPGNKFTYDDLWQIGTQYAGTFQRLGVGKGDTVLMMLDNSPDYALALIGANFAGAIYAPTNTAFKGALLEHIIASSRASTAVVEARLVDRVLAAAHGQITTLVVRGYTEANDQRPGVAVIPLQEFLGGEPIEPVETNAASVLYLGFTSGTSGPSKAAPITNLHALWNSAGRHHLETAFGKEDVFYIVCPLFHAVGMAGGLLAAWISASYAYLSNRFSVSGFWEEVNKTGATYCSIVGAMGQLLMTAPLGTRDREHQLRRIYMVPAMPDLRAFKERFGVPVSTGYGLTETGGIIYCPDEMTPESGLIGVARPGFDVRLADGHDMEVSPGQVGEIVVRADLPWLISNEYIGDPQATTRAWRNGWFHTGDAARNDNDGIFYFVDRVKDVIRRRGENIASFEIEREALRHPGITDCAAVGVGADIGEQEVLITAVRDKAGPAVTEADLIHFLIPRLPYYAVPRYIEFMDELPRSTSSKVMKQSLRERGASKAWDRDKTDIAVPRD